MNAELYVQYIRMFAYMYVCQGAINNTVSV